MIVSKKKNHLGRLAFYILQREIEMGRKRKREGEWKKSTVMLIKYFSKISVFVLYYFTKRDSCYTSLTHQSEGCL